MTESELAAVRAALEQMRAALLAEGTVEVKVEAAEPVASKVDEDDAPYREMGQSIASARNRERAERMGQIDDALRRLAADPDAFGVCEACEEEIPPRRLALLPFVRLCVACQSARETRGPAVRKKVTDYR